MAAVDELHDRGRHVGVVHWAPDNHRVRGPKLRRVHRLDGGKGDLGPRDRARTRSDRLGHDPRVPGLAVVRDEHPHLALRREEPGQTEQRQDGGE